MYRWWADSHEENSENLGHQAQTVLDLQGGQRRSDEMETFNGLKLCYAAPRAQMVDKSASVL